MEERRSDGKRRKEPNGGLREVTAASLSNCVDKKQASFISPSHSPAPLSSSSPSVSLSPSPSLTEAKNNEVTPLSRTVPY